MESYLTHDHYDLITPDGKIERLTTTTEGRLEAEVVFTQISPRFKGFDLDLIHTSFNQKSTLAQLGVEGHALELELDRGRSQARARVILTPIGPLAEKMIGLLREGAYIGKLFAADPRRIVRQPEYLTRMFGRSDRKGRPLLSLGGLQGSSDLVLGSVDGHAVAYLGLRNGIVSYRSPVEGLLPTIEQSLHYPHLKTRELLALHQQLDPESPHIVTPGEILLVKTLPLHIRTVFAVVVDSLLPKGIHHTSARVLDPTTSASGDIYELYGSSAVEINDIPLQFYTLEPHREHVFFGDRDQLQAALEDPRALKHAFATAPKEPGHRAAVFVVKGEQLRRLEPADWITREPHFQDLPGLALDELQALAVDRWINQQPATPFLKAIEDGLITSQGILLIQYLPTPYLKRLLIADLVQRCLKGIYFQHPSQHHGEYFSADDRALLADLAKFAIPVYWLDQTSESILRYVPRPGKDSGMFVPLNRIREFETATFFGIYGSNLLEGDFEHELRVFLEGAEALRKGSSHPLLNRDRPLAMVTGGGPGAMEVGNRVARALGILSCANVVNFGPAGVVNEQRQNPFIDAKMTYRLDKLVERQAEFDLDFPIFLMGGIGTDFEFSLEEVRRKTGATTPTPVFLFGPDEYWASKLSSRFATNRASGTIRGSEWVSNCFYSVQTGAQALEVLQAFTAGTLEIGPHGPIFDAGFCGWVATRKG